VLGCPRPRANSASGSFDARFARRVVAAADTSMSAHLLMKSVIRTNSTFLRRSFVGSARRVCGTGSVYAVRAFVCLSIPAGTDNYSYWEASLRTIG